MNDLAAKFIEQAGHCDALGSPFMGQLCRLLADRLTPGTALTDRLFHWQGDLGPAAQSLPLRLCGGLHALRLTDRAGLAAVYPPHRVSDDVLWDAIDTALRSEAEFLDDWIDSPPQTNEVRRSAVLIGIGNWLTARFGLPLVLSELGASGGLDLMWDRFELIAQNQHFGPDIPALTLTPDWSGPLPPKADPIVAERRGVDLNPLDPTNPDDRLRLLAYLWPDQTDRIDRTLAAIDCFDAKVDRADGVDWLASRLVPLAGRCHLIYSTVAWQYFPKSARDRGTDLIAAAGALATEDAPIAWFGMENDGGAKGAALTLRLWPGDLQLSFGRADFHGRWVDWVDPLQA